MAKRDFVLKEPRNRITSNHRKGQDHYLSSGIQNELIFQIAEEMQKANIRQLKLTKYICIIFDCTLHVSHREQVSVICRCVQYDREKEAIVR